MKSVINILSNMSAFQLVNLICLVVAKNITLLHIESISEKYILSNATNRIYCYFGIEQIALFLLWIIIGEIRNLIKFKT